MDSKTYVVSNDVFWLYTEPPRGKKILMLSAGGMLITGTWSEKVGHIAWHPLLKRNKEIEKTLGIK